MIRLLRYLAIRLWICAGAGIPLAFVLMPYVDKMVPGIHPAVGVGLIVGGLFFTAGFLLNLAGKTAIAGQIREAETWARAGIVLRSEAHFLKALRIYDSFLLSPWQAGESALKLAGSVARFSLAHGNTNRVFYPLTTLFLGKVPHEREVALLWLKRFLRMDGISSREQDLLEGLADTWADDPEIGLLLADLFIKSGRRDYCAKKLYSMALGNPATESRTRSAILNIIGTEEELFPIPDFSDGFYDRGDGLDRSAGTLGSGVKQRKKIAQPFFYTLGRIPKSALVGVTSFLKKGVFYFKESKKARKTLQWGVILLLCSGFIFFMTNTMVHLFNERHRQPGQESIELQVLKPYTIQVAAYLKKDHAQSYLGQLKRNGLDAYLAKADGGGRTWYLVRISAFQDRQAAGAYGRQLKQEGKIEDFFVDNNDGTLLDTSR